MRFEKVPSVQPSEISSQIDYAASAKSLAICSTPEARLTLDYDLAQQLCVLPLGYCSQGAIKALQFAIPPGTRLDLQAKLKFASSSEVQCVEVNKSVLSKAIQIAYRTDDTWLEKGLSQLDEVEKNKIDSPKSDFIVEDSSSPVPQALKTLLEYGIAKDASDIHLIPTVDGLTVKLRVNGELLSHQQTICSGETGARLISRIKVLARLRLDEKSLPQDGSFSLNLKSGPRQLRISILPTIHGEKCVMRITSDCGARSLTTVGFSDSTQLAIGQVLKICSGLILLSGSTGSGKSTTLYSIVQQLISKNLSVCSVEDPVEAHIAGMSQTGLAPHKGLDYPNALRSILRQDPDVILVGEIRDSESAKLVISAALTGHLVLSTVHGSNLAESIMRLNQMGIDKSELTQVLRLIINQSLFRKLCSKCKTINLYESQSFGVKVFKAIGCASCDYSGYDGRLLVAERMLFTAKETVNTFVNTDPTRLSELFGYESPRYYFEKYLSDGLIEADDVKSYTYRQ